MNGEPCGHALDDVVWSQLDTLLEYCGNLESDVKDLRRRVAALELLGLLMSGELD